MTDEGAKNLAAAIILQAYHDFVRGYIGYQGWSAFCFSEYFAILTSLDPDAVYKQGVKVREEKWQGKKRHRKK